MNREMSRVRRAQRRKSMAADEWNERHPVGTPVHYRPIWGEQEYRETRTRSEAWALGHGESVVKVEGVSGCVALWALEVQHA